MKLVTKPIIDKNISPEIFSEKLKPIALRIKSLKTDKIKTLSEPFCMFDCHGDLFGQTFASSGCRRCLLQDEDHSGSRPHSFPGL